MRTRPEIRSLAYRPDSAELFARLQHLPWSLFLDSARPYSRRGRYDIFSADPQATLVTFGDTTTVASDAGVERSKADPFELLKAALGPPREGAGDLPFVGGAMGYFAYDLARRIERLPQIALADSAMPDMAIGIYDWAVVVDHQLRRATLLAWGEGERSAERWQTLLDSVPSRTPVAYSPSFQVLSAVRSEIPKSRYADAFARIKHYIREGDCYQVNLAQRFSARARGEPWEAYCWLRRHNPAPFSAYVGLPEGAVLSSSPERFLQVRRGLVETRPIKGTRPRHADPERDAALAAELAASGKDRAENLMIVDLLRNDIGKVCAIGSVKVPSLFAIESFATVHHLVSTVTGRLAPGKHAIDLLRGCFPGGSITGAPKLRAMEIIEELESHRRGVYCGSIGYIGFDGAMDCNIAIRTLVHHGGQLQCWAGGGIVFDSEMEAEYQESLDKASAMLDLFKRTEASDVGV